MSKEKRGNNPRFSKIPILVIIFNILKSLFKLTMLHALEGGVNSKFCLFKL